MAAFGRTAQRLAAATLAAAALGGPAGAQSPPGADEEIVVRGRSPAELRAEIELARDAVIARFNDINSDDRFDIHCRLEPRVGSKLEQRVCQSNSWRDQDANFAFDFLRELRGETGANSQQYRAEQLRVQSLLEDEMRRLAVEDPELREAFLRLGGAMRAADGEGGERAQWTLFREVTAGADGLPFGARQVFEVRLGAEPWVHALTQRTFTLGQVAGSIRRLELRCDEVSGRLSYAPDIEWTVPEGWTGCSVIVRGKRGTTFLLLEFE
jgi:hypothetical protein